MISKEHIQLLDTKIKQAVSLIQQLKMENSVLRQKLGNYESRIHELEEILGGLKANQQVIEAGLLQAIKELDKLENSSNPQDSSFIPKNSSTEEPLTQTILFSSKNEEINERPIFSSSATNQNLEQTSSNSDDQQDDADDLKNRDPGLGIF